MPSPSFIHHDTIDYKEQVTYPNTMVYGQRDEETTINCWFTDEVLRIQINNGVISKFPKLPGRIQRLGVVGGTVFMVVVLENNQSALYKAVDPQNGAEMRVSYIRDIRQNEEFGINGLWLRKSGSSCVYPVCDKPESEGILIDTEERILGDAQPIAVHRFCLIYYKKTKTSHPSIHRLSSNVIVVEHNEETAHSMSEWMFPSAAFAVDESPIVVILTIAGNLIFVDVDALTVNVVKKKYEHTGIRHIFKGVNSFRRIVGVVGESIVVEVDVISGAAAHSSSYKVFKAHLPQKYKDMLKRNQNGKVSKAASDVDPVQLVRYVQYLAQCSECGEQQCNYKVRSYERTNHQKINFEKKKKGMEDSFTGIMNKLNDTFKTKKSELFAKSSAPSLYEVLWGELLTRRKAAQDEFDEAMSLMEAARRLIQ